MKKLIYLIVGFMFLTASPLAFTQDGVQDQMIPGVAGDSLEDQVSQLKQTVENLDQKVDDLEDRVNDLENSMGQN